MLGLFGFSLLDIKIKRSWFCLPVWLSKSFVPPDVDTRKKLIA